MRPLSNRFRKWLKRLTIKRLCAEFERYHAERIEYERKIEECFAKAEAIQRHLAECNKPLSFETLCAKHLRTCGTQYRGCDPRCPKEIQERLDEERAKNDSKPHHNLSWRQRRAEGLSIDDEEQELRSAGKYSR